MSFYVSTCGTNNKDGFQFSASQTAFFSPSTYLTNLGSDTDIYKPTSIVNKSGKLQVTALALVDAPKNHNDNKISTANASGALGGNSSSSSSSEGNSTTLVRPCLVTGVIVSPGFGIATTNPSTTSIRGFENVWTASTDLASSSTLVQAMNSVNSATSSTNDSLDIMKVASATNTYSSTSTTATTRQGHYLVLFDFHHKMSQPQPNKKDGGKGKKQLSGTGTSASSNGIRQESLYQEMLLSKFLLEEINEDVDSEMVGATHFDNIYSSPPVILAAAPTPNGIFYGINTSTPTSSSFDSNSNPIFPLVPEPYASTSKITQLRKTLDTIKTTKAEPVVVQTIKIDAEDSLTITNIVPTKDGKHLFVILCPSVSNVSDAYTNTNKMDVDDECKFFKNVFLILIK